MAETDPTVGVVFDQLADASDIAEDVKDLVVGALLDELDAAIDGDVEAPQRRPGDEQPPAPAKAYLGEITVEGFRGIGRACTLPLQPGPGLTLVVGRNGSGKSSFAEAAEIAVTGECSRWADRKSKIWQEGWANLHAGDAPRISVDIAVDGEPGTRAITGQWANGNDLTAVEWEIRSSGGGDPQPQATLGWEEPLALYRPFLSYNELGSLLEEGPSRLYDALASILGLDALTEAAKRLADLKKARADAAKATKAEAKLLATTLAGIDDDRAQQAATCLKGTRWDLDRLATLVLGDTGTADTESAHLARLSELTGPDGDRAGEIAAALRSALTARADIEGTDADRAHRTAELLRMALDLHAAHGDMDCPVCGDGRLDDARAGVLTDEAAELLRQSGAARSADAALAAAVEDARRLLAAVPSSLAPAADGGVTLDELDVARSAWEAWTDAPDEDPAALADHLEQRVVEVADATAALATAAVERHRELEDLWRPWATQLAAFLPAAEDAQASDALGKRLKQAEDWLRAVGDEIRDQRFEPVAEQVKQTWAVLRQNSSVEIADVVLAGSKTRRRVDVQVNVDDVDGVALGVMSQGELHALALSLFVPRATLPASPFGFLLIDDPVQAMDPARVDGLASLLDDLATTRQVVVFTHDDRLPDACRRLGLDARVIEVTRRPSSVVEVREAGHPAYTHLNDAWGVAKSAKVPEDVVRRVVPGLCRHAVEAACMDVSRRRLLAAGTPHAEVEDTLAAQATFLQQLALALLGDPDKAGDVMGTVNSRWGGRAGDTVMLCNKGTHGVAGTFSGVRAKDLVSDTRTLVDHLLEL